MVTFVPKFVNQARATRAGDGAAGSRPPRTLRALRQPRATLDDVVAHVEHVREVAGVDHVGLGGDYDGVDWLPEGLEDVTGYPRLLAALADRGWSDEDLARLTCRNVLRAMGDAGSDASRRARHRVTRSPRRRGDSRAVAVTEEGNVADRRTEGSQEPRVPGGDHADRGARARGPRPRGARREGRRRRLADRRRGVRRRGRHDPRLRRRRVGRGRDGAQGQGAGRRGVPPDARGAGALHLPAPGRRPAADRGAGQAQGHRHRLRDRAAAVRLAAAALPDVGGGRLPRAAGRRATR